jgi:hypothetical protein
MKGDRREAGCKLTAGLDTEPRNSLRHTSGPCINSEDCNYYTSGLRGRL